MSWWRPWNFEEWRKEEKEKRLRWSFLRRRRPKHSGRKERNQRSKKARRKEELGEERKQKWKKLGRKEE